MLKKKMGWIILILIFVMLFSTTCFAANITIDLYEGETSSEIESPSTAYTMPDSTIANMSVTLGDEMVTFYKAGDQDLDSARFTFTRAGYNNNTYSIGANNVYLALTNNNVINANGNNITVATNNNGFRLSYRQNFTTRYLRYNNGFTASNANNNNTIYLYQKDPAGVGDGNGIPGYNRVTTVTNGGEYLIVYPNSGNYYILYPSTSNYTKQLTEVQEGEPSKYSFTGVTSGTTTATIGDDTYTINVYRRPDGTTIDKEIMVRRGDSYHIQTTIQGLTFSSLDTSIATVDSAGNVTGVAQGTTTIKATAPDGTMYLIPTTVYNNLYNLTVTIDADSHSNAYYSTNYSDISSAGKDEVIVFSQPNGSYRVFNIYAVPDDGYAIVEMAGTMTVINDDTPGEVRNGIGSSFIARHFNQIGREQIASNLEQALALGSEGVNGYTRDNPTSNSPAQTFIIRSEKLPTMSSNIYSVNGQPYQAGMNIKPGDVIIYEVNVLKDEMGEYLVIENGSISPSISGTTYIGTAPTGNSNSNSVSIDAGYTFDRNYYFTYTVPQDATGTINNTFTLNYDTYTEASIHTNNGGNNLSYKIDRTLTANTPFDVYVYIPEYEISFSNTVYGNAADQDKYFKYRIDIDVEDGEEFVITGQDATIEYEGQTINTSNKYISDSVNYIYLKHGQQATITVKSSNGEDYLGNNYTIVQQDGNDYETRVGGTITKTTGSIQIVENPSTIGFVNYKEVAPATNVNYDIIPFMLIIVITIIGLITIKYKKK